MNRADQKKFDAMKKAGAISSFALKKALESAKPGISLQELDKIAEDIILSQKALPAFKRVENYPFTTCININEGIVHGLPGGYKLKKGDILSIDIGAYIDGYNSDQCWTIEIDTNEHENLLKAGQEALESAIKEAHIGRRIGDISSAIEKRISQEGYSVSRDLVGHGIGRKVHERPNVPCYGLPHTGPILKEGMTLAVEVIYSEGSSDIVVSEDGWTIEALDGSISAVFEHSIGITSQGPLVFTEF
jgi:methionyl aminopeptidase